MKNSKKHIDFGIYLKTKTQNFNIDDTKALLIIAYFIWWSVRGLDENISAKHISCARNALNAQDPWWTMVDLAV